MGTAARGVGGEKSGGKEADGEIGGERLRRRLSEGLGWGRSSSASSHG